MQIGPFRGFWRVDSGPFSTNDGEISVGGPHGRCWRAFRGKKPNGKTEARLMREGTRRAAGLLEGAPIYLFSMCPMFLSSMDMEPSDCVTNSMKLGFMLYSEGKVISMPVSVRMRWLRLAA